MTRNPTGASAPVSAHNAAFQETQWSLVLRATHQDSSVARPFLESLCQLYWPCIYTFLRHSGYNREDAHDLTQEFFVFLLGRDFLEKADQSKGRFRYFLLGALKNFLRNERRKSGAIKRGGQVRFVWIDAERAEQKAVKELKGEGVLTPDKVYDRHWADTVLNQAMEALERDYARHGQSDLLAALKPFLTGDADQAYRELAWQLDKSEGALRALVKRMRAQFRGQVRQIVLGTVEAPWMVEEELELLKDVLRGGR